MVAASFNNECLLLLVNCSSYNIKFVNVIEQNHESFPLKCFILNVTSLQIGGKHRGKLALSTKHSVHVISYLT